MDNDLIQLLLDCGSEPTARDAIIALHLRLADASAEAPGDRRLALAAARWWVLANNLVARTDESLGDAR